MIAATIQTIYAFLVINMYLTLGTVYLMSIATVFAADAFLTARDSYNRYATVVNK